ILSAGCGSPPVKHPPPQDPDLEVFNATARLEFDRGSLGPAAASYARALDRARMMDDAAAIATAAYNLAVCRAALGDYPAARMLLDEADREARRSNLSTADVYLALARIALLEHDPTATARLSDAVLNPEARPDTEQRAQAHVLHGLAACDLSDAGLAKQQLDAARSLAATVKDPALDASVWALSAAVHLLAHDWAAAAADFDREADLRRTMHQYRELERALTKAGRAFAAVGDHREAADRLYRAARAAAARGGADAPALASEANTAARKAGDESLVRLTASLQQSLTVATTPATRPAID
ncbi:MAG TPA: hypothetical protein VLI90_05180, partial [Tepidisphaeraceae bacterium]|nr:hypothetical protein [Tepidisphaeraceae bacterium]